MPAAQKYSLQPQDRRYLRREAAAEYLSCSVRYLDQLKANGEIPFIRMASKIVVYDIEDLDQYMARLKVKV